MSHFTYKTPDNDKLLQGDILDRTEELLHIFSQFHPHYSIKPDYRYFMVLTQSCDLVRRKENNNQCTAQYITLAAIRPLELVIEREIRKYQEDALEINGQLIDRKKQTILQRFIAKLLNNNEITYFYLNEDASMGFSESCVAFLRLSVPLKADLHYDVCLRAKKLELADNFKSKLGWMVGQIYSRVATEDWTPKFRNNEQFQDMIKQILEVHCLWIDNIKEFLKVVRSKYSADQLAKMTAEELQKLASEIKIPSKKEILLDHLNQILLQKNIPSPTAKDIIENVRNDTNISALFSK